MLQRHPVDRAADAVGGASNLAAALGVSVQAVSNWKERGVPIERCVALEQLSGATVTRKDLRPDDWEAIWPELAASTDTGQRRRSTDINAKAAN